VLREKLAGEFNSSHVAASWSQNTPNNPVVRQRILCGGNCLTTADHCVSVNRFAARLRIEDTVLDDALVAG
jgi:hypothetical protein